MCPNPHSEGLVRGRGTRWRPLVSPAGSSLISCSVATHGSALAFPHWHWGFSSVAVAACSVWGAGMAGVHWGAVQWSVQPHSCAPWQQDRDTVPPELDTANAPPLGCSLITSPPLPATFPGLQPCELSCTLRHDHTGQLGRAAKSGRGMGTSSLHRGCFRKWKGSGLSTSFPLSFPPIPCNLWGSAPINPHPLSPKAHDPSPAGAKRGL